MKSIITILSFLLFSFSVYAQKKDAMGLNQNTINFLDQSLTKKKDSLFIFPSIEFDFLKETQFFTKYNYSTGYNDNYFIKKNSSVYMNSKMMFQNDYRHVKKDSFNPHGAPKIGSGLALGVFDFLLNEIQN